MLKGVVRAERLSTPEDYIPAILDRVKLEYLQKQYDIPDWHPDKKLESEINGEEEQPAHLRLLKTIAYKMGKLLRGGEPDVRQVAVIVINDWQRVRQKC